MTILSHIVEPEALLLTWQPSDEHSPNRSRRVVARIKRNGGDSATFQYLVDTEDYELAIAAGFRGHPAFQLGREEIRNGVVEAFLRRLPPRKREDFSEFLALHRLPDPFIYSDFALLGYTGARLPSDGFAITPVLNVKSCPCDYIFEIAGFRYESEVKSSEIPIGVQVTFKIEPENQHDPGAVSIYLDGKKLGYVNRTFKGTVSSWIKDRSVTATIERINGKPERPLVYIRIEVK